MNSRYIFKWVNSNNIFEWLPKNKLKTTENSQHACQLLELQLLLGAEVLSEPLKTLIFHEIARALDLTSIAPPTAVCLKKALSPQQFSWPSAIPRQAGTLPQLTDELRSLDISAPIQRDCYINLFQCSEKAYSTDSEILSRYSETIQVSPWALHAQVFQHHDLLVHATSAPSKWGICKPRCVEVLFTNAESHWCLLK